MLDLLKNENSSGRTLNTIGNAETPIAVLSNKKKTLQIFSMPATIGKNGEASDIAFFHDSVGAVHCRFDCRNRQVSVTDLGTVYGTQINGQRIESNVQYSVDTGDKITIGKVRFDLFVSYEEIARREREAMLEAQKNAQPQEKIYTISAREVSRFEYDESEVVYISCGLEPLKKKARFTQEISINDIRAEADKAVDKAEEKPDERVSENADENVKDEPVLCLTGVDKSTGVTDNILIDHFPFRIGRKNSVNDYVIRAEGISREHMMVTSKEGSYFVTDTMSTNGVKVNGVRIPPAMEYKISPGDRIKLSNRTYTVGFAEK